MPTAGALTRKPNMLGCSFACSAGTVRR
jgi:hypothetical protein